MFYFPCPICVLRSYQNPMQRGTPLTNEDDTPTLKPLTHQPYKVSVGASNLLSNETQNSMCFFRLWTFPVVDFLFNKKLIVYHSNPTTVASAKKWSPIDLGSDLFRVLGPKAGHQRGKNGTAFGSLEGELRYWWKFRESRGFGFFVVAGFDGWNWFAWRGRMIKKRVWFGIFGWGGCCDCWIWSEWRIEKK